MKYKFILLIMSILVGLWSCSKDTELDQKINAEPNSSQLKALKTTSNASEKGHVHLFLRGVNNTQFVAGGGTLTHVDLVRKGNSAVDLVRTGNTALGKEDKRVTIFDGIEHFDDLLDMNSGIMLDLSGGEIAPPAGVYDFAVATVEPGSGWVKTADGTQYEIKFPGNQFRLDFKPAVVVTADGLSLDVVLDIDISQSLVPVQNGKFFIFKPVVKVMNVSTTGTLAGAVVNGNTGDLIPGALVYVDVNGITYSTQSLTDPYYDPETGLALNIGYYYLPYIPAGTYTAHAEKEGFTSSDVQVTITEGNFTFNNFYLLPQ